LSWSLHRCASVSEVAGWPCLKPRFLAMCPGSAFSFLAGLISPKPVVFQCEAKEGAEIDFYRLEGGQML
jgi:hypothetical protein